MQDVMCREVNEDLPSPVFVPLPLGATDELRCVLAVAVEARIIIIIQKLEFNLKQFYTYIMYCNILKCININKKSC